MFKMVPIKAGVGDSVQKHFVFCRKSFDTQTTIYWSFNTLLELWQTVYDKNDRRTTDSFYIFIPNLWRTVELDTEVMICFWAEPLVMWVIILSWYTAIDSGLRVGGYRRCSGEQGRVQSQTLWNKKHLESHQILLWYGIIHWWRESSEITFHLWD